MAEKKPNPMSDLLIFVVALVGLGILWVATGGPDRARSGSGQSLFTTPYVPSVSSGQAGYRTINSSLYSPSDSHTTGVQLGRGATSTWYGKVRLRRGSWSGVDYSFQEYIYIENNSYGDQAATATISGWKIKNRGRFTGYPDQAIIPMGVKTFVGGGNNLLEPVKLAPGERAIINTGQMVSADPYQFPSGLKVNKCLGYLSTAGQGLFGNSFYPALSNRCVSPSREPGAQETLNDDCLKFVSNSVTSCMTVKFNEYGGLIGLGREEVNDREGKKRTISLPQFCLNYLRNHFNYNSCVSVHKNDSDFYSREWRIWLGQSRKLYAPDRETITLYDKFGKIVDQVSY